MKTLTVKIPEPLLAEIEAAARERRVSRSVIIRERLKLGAGRGEASISPDVMTLSSKIMMAQSYEVTDFSVMNPKRGASNTRPANTSRRHLEASSRPRPAGMNYRVEISRSPCL